MSTHAPMRRSLHAAMRRCAREAALRAMCRAVLAAVPVGHPRRHAGLAEAMILTARADAWLALAGGDVEAAMDHRRDANGLARSAKRGEAAHAHA